MKRSCYESQIIAHSPYTLDYQSWRYNFAVPTLIPCPHPYLSTFHSIPHCHCFWIFCSIVFLILEKWCSSILLPCTLSCYPWPIGGVYNNVNFNSFLLLWPISQSLSCTGDTTVDSWCLSTSWLAMIQIIALNKRHSLECGLIHKLGGIVPNNNHTAVLKDAQVSHPGLYTSSGRYIASFRIAWARGFGIWTEEKVAVKRIVGASTFQVKRMSFQAHFRFKSVPNKENCC